MKIGSLFTGCGGLDMAAEAVLDARAAWVSDIDPGACKILAHRYPDVPNLGDITRVDWASVEPVDILTGGFPCQDLSVAGLQAGLKPGTRSGLWTHMAYAIDQLRPRLVVVENVRGLLSATAHSDVEPCPWCMGGAADGEPALRALGAVLGDLADLGYDAAWHGLRAADVGAPHGRFRIFVVAWPAGDPNGIGPEWDRDARQWGNGFTEDRRGMGRVDIGDASTSRQRQRPRPRPRPEPGDRGPADAPDTDSDGLPLVGRIEPLERDLDGRRGSDIAWGAYEPAIRRWEHILDRTAPPPTERDLARTCPTSAATIN